MVITEGFELDSTGYLAIVVHPHVEGCERSAGHDPRSCADVVQVEGKLPEEVACRRGG